MATNTTTYSFLKPTVGGDTNLWGGYLNSNWDDTDDLLDGTTPVTGIDIDSGSIDGTPIGAAAASTGAFTTLSASGDVTFDTTGVVWDQSTARLGLGTATPSNVLHIETSDNVGFLVESTDPTSGMDIKDPSHTFRQIVTLGLTKFQADPANTEASTIGFAWEIDGSEIARLTGDIRFGLGEASPADEIHITSASPAMRLEDSTDSSYASIGYDAATLTIDADAGAGVASSALVLATDNTTALTVNDGQAVLISPEAHDLSTLISTSTVDGVALRPDGATAIVRDGARVLYVNRITDDGVVVSIRQDGTEEGSIEVSGTTVTYNGGHLGRWSRLPGAATPELYKGTVMSNLDEMVEWVKEDNEQLNMTKVSDVAGDKNVAGLFVKWDKEDDYGDYTLAMTGDLIVRIAQGVTVQRGDLLESAGDGTARPQDDDIIRSKTVAKVTSTHVSHIYPDGSYAVPCVVLAS